MDGFWDVRTLILSIYTLWVDKQGKSWLNFELNKSDGI